MHRFFVPKDQITDNIIIITGSDVNHINNVLRLEEGSNIEVFDGAGNSYIAKLTKQHNNKVICSFTEAINTNSEPKVRVTLAQCLPKAKKMDFIVQKAVELGVENIIPVISERSVPKIEDKADKKISHWHTVAKEAAEQSGRAIVPTISPLTNFNDLIKTAKNYGLALIPWENEKEQTLKTYISNLQNPNSQLLIVIGPEGGFSKKEAAAATVNGFKTVSLGKRILRCETAGIVALAQIFYELD